MGDPIPQVVCTRLHFDFMRFLACQIKRKKHDKHLQQCKKPTGIGRGDHQLLVLVHSFSHYQLKGLSLLDHSFTALLWKFSSQDIQAIISDPSLDIALNIII